MALENFVQISNDNRERERCIASAMEKNKGQTRK
jgi:hypothetical protein